MQSLDTLLGVDEVEAKYGVSPSQLCDYQAIIGDSAVSATSIELNLHLLHYVYLLNRIIFLV